MKLLGAIIIIFAAANIIDWFFSGSKWAHKYFEAFPEIWRPRQGGDVSKEERLVVKSALGYTLLFSTAFALGFLLLQPGFIFRNDFIRALVVAIVFWLIIPVPIAGNQYLFIKMHKGSSWFMALGWLAKLFIAALIMAFFF